MSLNETPTSLNNALCCPLMPKIIESERISLRQLEPTQKNAQILAASVSENVKHLSEFMTGFCCLKDPQKALEKLQKVHDKETQCYYFIFHKEQLIGSICLLEDDRDIELQYWLDKYYEGSGFISETIKAVEKQAFQLTSKPLMLMIDRENTRSQRVALKANFYPMDSQKTEWIKTYKQFTREQQRTQSLQKWRLSNFLTNKIRERT